MSISLKYVSTIKLLQGIYLFTCVKEREKIKMLKRKREDKN